jgi:hypothetical protein
MSEEKANAPLSGVDVWITRTTAILAVLAALSSGRWGASNLEAILEQGKVNDGWAEYQSKSIKQHVAREAATLAKALHADPAAIGSLVAESNKAAKDKVSLHDKAEGYEKDRDGLVERSFWYEISFAGLQLGVVMCTIAAATRRKGLWIAAIVLAVLGLGAFANGFLLVVHSGPNRITERMTESLEEDSK